MIQIHIELLQQGMVTARDIFSTDGTLILPKQSVLTQDNINRLREAGFDSLYVQNPHLPSLEPFDRHVEKIKIEAASIIHRECADIRLDRKVNFTCINNISEMIIDCVLSSKNLLIHLSDIRAHHDYTFGHSVNVCLLSIMTGIKMGYENSALHELAVGALLHDLGKLLVPNEIIAKPAPLTAEEWKIMRQHVALGYAMVTDQEDRVSSRSAAVILQHHENQNGKGYPSGLSGAEIDEYAKIAAVADMYDAITASRTYRPASYQHDAYHAMIAAKGIRLDPLIVDVFLNNVAEYPVGTVVLLSTCEIAVVIESFADPKEKPMVKIIADKYKRSAPGLGRLVDLKKETGISILRILGAEEIFSIKD